jgi:hypothetical protein
MVVVFVGGGSSSGFTCFGSFCDVGVVARIVSFFVGCVTATDDHAWVLGCLTRTLRTKRGERGERGFVRGSFFFLCRLSCGGEWV